MGWYSEVLRDVGKITKQLNIMSPELVDARKEVKLVGNVEKASAAMPGIVEQSFFNPNLPRNLSNITLYEYRAT